MARRSLTFEFRLPWWSDALIGAVVLLSWVGVLRPSEQLATSVAKFIADRIVLAPR